MTSGRAAASCCLDYSSDGGGTAPFTCGVTGLYGGGMALWWHRDMIAAGKLPLMLCFLAFVVRLC